MIARLFIKEFKQTSFLAKKGVKKIFNLISSLLLLALFIVLEVVLYINIFDKVNVYTGFNDALFIIISFALFIAGIFSLVPITYNAFFKNSKERIILGTSPASTFDIIFAKALNIFFKSLLFTFSTIFALSVAYGVKSEADFLFFVLMFFNSIAIAILLETFAFILVIPFREIRKVISRFKIVSFIVMMIFLIALALLYGFILNLFVNLIRNDDIGSLFTTDNVELMKNVSNYLWPVSSAINLAKVNEVNLNFVIILSFIIFTGTIAIFAFNRYLTNYYQGANVFNKRKKHHIFSVKLTSIEGALIRKEFNLALSNSDGIFSYISLIILEPFLVFSVISAVNLIFNTGNLNYISTLFPAIFLTVDVILIMLFIAIINTTSSMSLTKEKNTLIIMKTLPVSYFKQLLIKISVPTILSFISYLVTILALVIFNEISYIDFAFLILVGALSILLLNLISLYNDLKSKSKSSLMTVLISFIFPLFAVGVGVLLSLLVEAEFETLVFFASIIVLEILVILFFVVKVKSRVTKLFMKYEGEARWKRKPFSFYYFYLLLLQY